jgi:opacity protein-like surface antigen
MKAKLIATTVAVALVAIVAAQAHAQTPAPSTPRVDAREAKQEQRIDNGVASGALNSKEAARLEAGQARVAAAEDKAKADGVVTKKERAKLAHKQNKQSKKIYRQKHDKQVAPPVAPTKQ